MATQGETLAEELREYRGDSGGYVAELTADGGFAEVNASYVADDVAVGGREAIRLPAEAAAPSHEHQADFAAFGGYRVPVALRLFEIVVASIALALSAPVMLVVAAVVKLGTPGPALFRHHRIGVNGKLFQFTKFRTLYADAKQRWPELYAYRYTEDELRGLKFKVKEDPRITPQGKWLRKSTLDELPNFWHVLTGDMALVGPRPEIPDMLPYYKGKMLRKFSVRPGITGLAQTSGRGRLSFRDTVALDLQYVRKRSFWFDLRLLLKTFKMIVIRDGAF